MYEVNIVVGKNIRRLRRIRSLTQEQLALEAGISSDYLSRMELGKENPTIDVLARLAVALGAAITELFQDPQSAGINADMSENSVRQVHT